MCEDNKYIRFDWAIKHILRDKANFGVLEGLITVLLDEPVKILEILESESNQNTPDDKFNRVDIKAKNDKGHIIIIEVQLTRQLYYLQRILYGTAKTIVEHINLGDKYDNVKKVYSISILYCDLGKGSDYVYHGRTEFRGINTGDSLMVTTKEKDSVIGIAPAEVFPEYYLIRVNEFDKIPQTPLEEWMDYLKNGRVNESSTAPGLQEVREKLQCLNMTVGEKEAYDRHIDNIMVQNDVLETAKTEGFAEGRAEGRAESRAEGRAEGRKEGEMLVAKRMLDSGMDIDIVKQISGLTDEEIEAL